MTILHSVVNIKPCKTELKDKLSDFPLQGLLIWVSPGGAVNVLK